MDALNILKIALNAADDKKAEDLMAIKVEGLTIITDYFCYASGNSSTQVKAIANEIEDKLAQAGIEPHHIEGKSSGWILLDYGTVIFHVMQKDSREFYNLEKLWADGEQLDVSSYID